MAGIWQHWSSRGRFYLHGELVFREIHIRSASYHPPPPPPPFPPSARRPLSSYSMLAVMLQ